MKLLFYIHHPAQFHLFKNVITELKKSHKIIILATKKDILIDLLNDYKLDFINVLPNGRGNSKIAIAWGLLKQDYRLWKICIKERPDLLIGTSTEITHIGKLLKINSIFVNEDDVEVIPLVGSLAYPFAKHLLVPDVCSTGKWLEKKITHSSYHELSYLHPNHFNSDRNIVKKYIKDEIPYFIIRFAKLGAHHDKGIDGINDDLAVHLINILKLNGNIIISSERELIPELEIYRINIAPLDMHHVMSFAHIYIGDSQTMAAEAGVLGTPFIRYNSFVGRIGYLNDLENKYKLGFGILPPNIDELFKRLKYLLEYPDLKKEWSFRRQRMLDEKIDLAKFLNWFISNYPDSLEIIKKNPEYQKTFK
jgi:predicted glycosyltransferase